MVDFDEQLVLGKKGNNVGVLSGAYEGCNGGEPYDEIAEESFCGGI